ncbi:MAG: hypothetical protein H6558_02955 [Lewinellaceae bacterium]|nr:hypothetical protein [Lewinellaceae bacterium]
MDRNQIGRNLVFLSFFFSLLLSCAGTGALPPPAKINNRKLNLCLPMLQIGMSSFSASPAGLAVTASSEFPWMAKSLCPPVPQTRTLFIFSDSVIGNTENGKVKKGGFKMIHNLVVFLEGKEPVEENFEFWY